MLPSFACTGSNYRSRYALLAAILLAWPCLTLVLAASNPSPTHAPPRQTEYTFHYDSILGTSLDLVVYAPSQTDAAAGAQAVLDEIERLRQILSTYDPESEINHLNRATGPQPCSVELIEVLQAYELWQERSRGAFSGQLGVLIRTWKEAEKTGVPPEAATLARLVEQIKQPGWRIDEVNGTVERLTGQPLNVNAIGKGYIIGKAAAARAQVPAIAGLLVNLGGDLLIVGECGDALTNGWRIALTDPAHPEDNAPPLSVLRLEGGAVATSAGYERYYTFAGKRYSHIFDPRTGQPAEAVASATVVARDNVTANALATTLCVLPPEEGLELVKQTGAECLLVTMDGRQLRSAGLNQLEVPHVRAARLDAKESKWPADYQVTITFTLIKPTGGKVKRPYVAVWIENADSKPVRTLTVWGNEAKYQKDLTTWWKFAREDRDLVKAVTRATRPAGQYQLAWDGKDDKGNPVDLGQYTFQLEVHREHGKHVRQTGKIKCEAEKVVVTLAKNAETEDTKVEYGPRGK